MKDFNNIAKRNELEELCRLFIDGRLSVEEENDLALVLSYSQERGGRSRPTGRNLRMKKADLDRNMRSVGINLILDDRKRRNQ